LTGAPHTYDTHAYMHTMSYDIHMTPATPRVKERRKESECSFINPLLQVRACGQGTIVVMDVKTGVNPATRGWW
jgi:hypothetical protein